MTDILAHRTFHDTASPYPVPNDAREHQRLDEQGVAFVALMRGQMIHSPLDADIARILEIGCGTGSVTVALARTYPSATAIGIDLSPVPASVRAAAPPNAVFAQANFADAHVVDNPYVQPGCFDFVFSRLLVMGMEDWAGFYRKVFGALKPGGRVETQDIDQVWFDADGRRCSDEWPWLKATREAAEKKGLDYECARNAAGRMREMGFVDVETKNYVLPLGEWERYPEADEMGRFARRYLRAALQDVVVKMLRDDGVDEERIEQLRSGVLPDELWGKGIHRIATITCGRKPR